MKKRRRLHGDRSPLRTSRSFSGESRLEMRYRSELVGVFDDSVLAFIFPGKVILLEAAVVASCSLG